MAERTITDSPSTPPLAARRFDGDQLVIATHNKGKVKEIGALLAGRNVTCVSAGELGLPEPEETGLTFAENALLKAHAAAQASGLPALADDSGLAVAALNGEPGIYSARWAGPEKDFNLAMRTVHDAVVQAVGPDGDKAMAFVCVLALAWPDGHAEIFEGRIAGQMIWPPRGDQGFGYDPFFVPDGYTQSFAEIGGAAKNEISHRARALKALVAACFGG